MTKLSHPLSQVTVFGPDWNGKPFWQLNALTPHLFADLPEATRQQEDRIHSLRTLALNMTGDGEGEDVAMRRPRLVALQLLVGQGAAKKNDAKHKLHFSSYETGFSYSKVAVTYDKQSYPKGFDGFTPNSDLGLYYNEGRPVREESFSIQLDNDHQIEINTNQSWLHRGFLSKDTYYVTPSYFRTGSADAGPEDPKQPRDAEFQHVIATPVLHDREPWLPNYNDAHKGGQFAKEIRVPPMRLLHGAIDLAVADGAFSWLGDFQPPVSPRSTEHRVSRFVLRLTPDGIELTTKVNFPGQTTPLQGRFLLGPETTLGNSDGMAVPSTTPRLMLTFLPDKTDPRDLLNWKRAWQTVIPATNREEVLHGFRIAGQSNMLPAFRWEVLLAGDKPEELHLAGLSPAVEIPSQHIRLELLSPRSNGAIDGVVNVTGGYFYLLNKSDQNWKNDQNWKKRIFGDESEFKGFTENLDAELLLALACSTRKKPSSQLRITGGVEDANKLAVELKGSGYLCAHDEVHLAEQLRQAYGLPSLQPGVWDRDRPLLYGFVPMNDGWLQLPVPNYPTPDNSLDSALAGTSGAQENNVLEGFLRYKQQGTLPLVQSAFASGVTPAPDTQAPWSITVEGAQGLRVVVALKTSEKGSTPVRAMALLDEPELSTRGLLWLSADCPDALEALPRLGAGPGAYLDLPLERDKSNNHAILHVTIKALNLSATASEISANLIADAVTLRNKLELDVRFDKDGFPKTVPFDVNHLSIKTVYWQRHPQMPLVAQMPMTRTASSAVRPLESRDLVPFEVQAKTVLPSPHPILSLAELSWTQAVFAQMVARGYSVHSDWPWPVQQVVSGQALAINGIGLCAFGVPGVELRLPNTWAINPWGELQAALRYDLPVLDEAFASATLPPVPALDDAAASSAAASAPAADTLAATALDWRALAQFWGEQNRRHQLTRVAHSYLADYHIINDLGNKKISNLVGGLVWETAAGFAAGKSDDSLPYGALYLDGELAAGNVALQGCKANFAIVGGKLKASEAGAIPDVRVVGYSPSYFLKDDFLLDARGSGAAQVIQIGDATSKTSGLWRALKVLVTQPGVVLAKGMLSCESVLNVASVKAGVLPLFRFWFKDVPLDKEGKFNPAPGIDAAAWQDGHLLQSGFEWRLLVSSGHAGFENGNDAIAFCGMQLEPLRLLELQVPMSPDGVPTSALPGTVKILARLSLGGEQEWPDNDNSLLELVFAAMADGLYLESVAVSKINTGSVLRLPLVLAQKSVLLQIRSMAWEGGQLHLRQASMSFDFLEAEVALACGEVSINPAGGGRWELKSKSLAGNVANALMIAEAVLTVNGNTSRFLLKYKVVVSPQVALGVDTENPAISISGTEQWPGAAENADLNLLGAKAEAKVRSIVARRAFSVIAAQTTDNDGIDLDGALLPGFPSCGKLQFGMLASISEFDDKGVAKLVAGQLGGRIVKTRPSSCMTLTAMDFSATCQQRGNDSAHAGTWSGALVLYGSITVRNAISWPQINLHDSGHDIPYPSSDPLTPPLQSSLTKVVLLDDENYPNYLHEVQWLLDGHTMSFDLAQGMREKVTTAVWSAPVMARHTLFSSGNATVLEFSCVEALAMGAMAALLPRWEGANAAKDDGTARNTFAPRYRDQIINGKDTGISTPGMLHAGHGGLGTVLQGALSGAFRAACYASGAEDSHIVLAGGFVGMLLNDANLQGTAPLMRLPVLAGLHEGPLFVDREQGGTPPVTQRGVPEQELRLAWSDGAAAPKIRVTVRHSVASKGGSERALRDAMASGNLIQELEALGDPQMAILVEQSYPHDLAGTLPMDTPENRKKALKILPFFIGAAVSIKRAIYDLTLSPARQLQMSLSLLAGSDLSRRVKGKMQRNAALLLTRQGTPAAALAANATAVSSLQAAPAILMLVADDLVTQAWDGPSIVKVPESVALVASKAYAAHRRPRAALLRNASGQYVPIAIPAHHLQLQKRDKVIPVFADGGRGYALATGRTEAWLAGPEEGGAMAMRDYQPAGAGNGTGSGIAGFSRNAALRPSASDGPPIWLGQQRVPIYLPLQTRDLMGPAVPWLTPGAARTRLPTDASVRQMQDKLTDKDHPTTWQSIVPQQVMSTSLSDRPGILMARRMRLESRFADSVWDEVAGTAPHAFDSDHDRFGQPAQAGSSLARTERTPRPGPLPPNQNDLGDGGKSDPRFFRRPCASPLLPLVPLRALIGPADTVRGKIEKGEDDAWAFSDWSVTFIAAPETAGVITQASDGTLGLIAEIDVWPKTGSIDDDGWKKILLSLLFVDVSNDVNKVSAVLMIDSVAIPFNALHIRQAKNVDELPGTDFSRGRVALILDARVARDAMVGPPAAVGPVLPALANALSGSGPLPEVVVQLTVYPATSLPTVSKEKAWQIIKPQYLLAGAVGTVANLPGGLSKGDARAPVSLRMSLSPVLRDRGALPLQNAALLFTDPAYDADLAAPPYDDRKTLKETPPGSNRGQLELVLYADRRRISRRATVTLMADVHYQKNMDARLQTLLGKNVDGDLKPGHDVYFKLALRVQPKSGSKRDVFLTPPGNAVASVQIKLAQVYELALSALTEADGTQANLVAGDILELELTWVKGTLEVVNATLDVPPDGFFKRVATLELAIPPTLRMVLTNEPVIEPPQALYAALVHKTVVAQHGHQAALPDKQYSFSVPLYAQSPLPWRVDLQNAKADFRAGLMQRSATFIWSLGRPNEEFLESGLAVHIVKSDRNGQTYLPSAIEGNFINPERLIWVS